MNVNVNNIKDLTHYRDKDSLNWDWYIWTLTNKQIIIDFLSELNGQRGIYFMNTSSNGIQCEAGDLFR